MRPRLQLMLCSLLVAVMTMVCVSRGEGRRGAPEGWSRTTRGQPFVSQSVLAAGPQSWNVWSLAAYQGFVADSPADSVSVDVTLSERGRIVLGRSADEETSALVLEVGNAPSGFRLLPDGGKAALSCTGNPLPTEPGRVKVTLMASSTGWSASIGEQRLDCATTAPAGRPALTAGLRRVEIHALSTDGPQAGGPGSSAMVRGLGAGLGVFLLLGWIGRRHSGIATAVGLGLTSGWLLLPFDGARLVEVLRLIEVSEDRLPLTFAAVMATTAGAVGVSIRWSRSRHLVIALLPTLALFLGIAAAWPVIGAMGWLYAGFAGLSLGGLVWVNVHTPRHYNLIALALAGTLLGSTEVMARFSHVGSLWSNADSHHGAGSMGTLIAQFEGLKSGVHPAYPGSGFPVRLPPKQAALRVACLGASSTGGAFQNDSLDEFFPARLAELGPPGTEVVNQGVAGWTSFHIRKFLDRHVDSLNAEIWTLYLGVNERMPTRMSFADLYDAWEGGSLANRSGALDDIRLFQALRLLVRGMQPGAGAGVPPADFRENLSRIVTLARKRGVKVLLLSEGIRPDPGVLWGYTGVMDELATGGDVHFLDTARVLDAVGDPAFLDANHLTDTGHRAVAAAIDAELDRLGWW